MLRQTHVYTCHIDTPQQIKEKKRDICDDGGVSTKSCSKSAYGKFQSLLLHFCSSWKKSGSHLFENGEWARGQSLILCFTTFIPSQILSTRVQGPAPLTFFHTYLLELPRNCFPWYRTIPGIGELSGWWCRQVTFIPPLNKMAHTFLENGEWARFRWYRTIPGVGELSGWCRRQVKCFHHEASEPRSGRTRLGSSRSGPLSMLAPLKQSTQPQPLCWFCT